jgi:outer membrane protein OmpA-like peptidoglycan-associated protein/ABC-type nitrate/sulfonate/bicarbonate transport system substrate-binding protein
MKTKKLFSLMIVLVMALASNSVKSQPAQYESAKPMSQLVNNTLKPVSTAGTIKVPMITWGGDVATIIGDMDGIFKNNGLNISLFREDDFRKQVQMCINGETPYLRGTMGMINAAADAFKSTGTELVVIYQLTWSVGGDAMVVRQGKNLNTLKTIGLQLYGPHMDYASNLITNAGRLGKVDFKWLSQLTISEKQGGKAIDPVTAFQDDEALDAAMCIIPDALLLTSNGATGTGSEGSVKGASILVSTKTASRVICDVYAVRKDYFDTNKSSVLSFVKSLMQAEETLKDLTANKTAQQSKYRQLISIAAEKLMGSSQFTSDAEALLADCEFVGFSGNKTFFTGAGTTRSFTKLNSEIQASFKSLGLLTATVTIANANWDYNQLASGLKNASQTTNTKPKFSQTKVAKAVENKISAESTSWEEEGTLFVVEINFDANQSDFTIEEYASDFALALNIAETNSGALVIIEGHADPLGILKAEKALANNEAGAKSKAEIGQMKQQVKSLSLERAQSVSKNFLQYCKNKKINIDESQFVAVGLGVAAPKYDPPRTKEEWAANRRVVFRIKQVEAELDEFSPLD